MRLVLVTLLLLSVIVSADKTQTIKFKLNDKELGSMVNDFKSFGKDYWNQTQAERQQLLRNLKDAYKTYVGKFILNFGSTIVPVVDAWTDVMKYVQVNSNCNQECAVKCLNPMKRDTMFFDQKCLGACGCQFDAAKLDKSTIKSKTSSLKKEVKELKDFCDDRKVEAWKVVKPALDDYLDKEKDLHEEFAAILKTHAVSAFGCDESCINDCLDDDFITFYEMPMCLAKCDCKQQLIDIEGGHFDYPQLMKTNKYDLKSWSFFKFMKDEMQ